VTTASENAAKTQQLMY